jgi:pyruvate/2-oxoglutarate dehydrogenase complex dihydrolipoamide acyltransferase (E2) component
MLYDIKLPQAGFSIAEGVIVEWNKKVGERVQKDETVVTVETDKITVEVPADVGGVLVQVRFKKGEAAPVGSVLGVIADEGDAEALAAMASMGRVEEERAVPAAAAARGPAVRAVSAAAGAKTPAARFISPVARKIAEEEGVDLSAIGVGSGPGGRIVKEDVLRFAKAAKAEAVKAPPAPQQAAHAPEKVKFVGWRKVIADRMISSAREVPQGKTLVEVDVTELAGLIQNVRKRIEKPKMTYLPFLMKAIQAGIEVTPEVNAYCYEDGFVIQHELNIGMAVDLGEKLIVPVIRNVKAKSILELAEDVQSLARKAREDRLRPEEVQGGTITITNLGPFDVVAAFPLILQPQTTIVAMGSVRDQPWISNGVMEMRKRAMVTGVFDHRAVNGAPGARFLKRVKDSLEDLSNLLLWLR